MAALNPIQKFAVNIGSDVLAGSAAKLAQNESVRRWVVRRIETWILAGLKHSRTDLNVLPGIADDRAVMGLGIQGNNTWAY
jgi:hypothetical protein